MTKVVEVMDLFERALLADAPKDAAHNIAREFALAQTRFGNEMAIHALAMCLIIADSRRRSLQAELELLRS